MSARKSNPWGQAKPTLGTSHSWAHPLSHGLVSHYLMNEGGGLTAHDTGKLRSPMALTSTSWSAGKFGQCLNFNGTSSLGVTSTDLRGAFTDNYCSLSCWFRATNATNVGGMVAIGDATNEWSLIQVTSQVWAVSQGPVVANQAVASLTALVWTHAVAVFYNDSSRSIFVNGKLVQNETSTRTVSPTTVKCGIGKRLTISQYYGGQLDDVRVYNRPITPTEVLMLYQMPFANIAGRRTMPAMYAASTDVLYAQAIF